MLLLLMPLLLLGLRCDAQCLLSCVAEWKNCGGLLANIVGEDVGFYVAISPILAFAPCLPEIRIYAGVNGEREPLRLYTVYWLMLVTIQLWTELVKLSERIS